MEMKANAFKEELSALINRFSEEKGSNTPDYILAEILGIFLTVWDQGVVKRVKCWENIEETPEKEEHPTCGDYMTVIEGDKK